MLLLKERCLLLILLSLERLLALRAFKEQPARLVQMVLPVQQVLEAEQLVQRVLLVILALQEQLETPVQREQE